MSTVAPVEAYVALHRWIERCRSPIEVRFSLALLVGDGFTFLPALEHFTDGRGVELHQQFAIDRYVADFVLLPSRIVVELDGVAFHDASPERSERDKRRDRLMLASGWRVMRFAGREVNRDAMACAREAYAAASGVTVCPLVEQLALFA